MDFIETVAVSARLQGVTAQVAVNLSPRCQKIRNKISKKVKWNQSNCCVSKKKVPHALNRPRHFRLMMMRYKELNISQSIYTLVLRFQIREPRNGYKKKGWQNFSVFTSLWENKLLPSLSTEASVAAVVTRCSYLHKYWKTTFFFF